MQLKQFDRNGKAEISISEEELNVICNALCEYCHITKPFDKRIYPIRERLYIFYEIVHNGALFDNDTLRILQRMRAGMNEDEGE